MKPGAYRNIKYLIPALAFFILLGRPDSVISHKYQDIHTPQSTAGASGPSSGPASKAQPNPMGQTLKIKNTVRLGETLSSIFSSHGLKGEELNMVVSAARGIHNLARLRTGNHYSIEFTPEGSLYCFTYKHEEESMVKVLRNETGFTATVAALPYERRTAHIGGIIRDNLVSSIGELTLALELSDIFAWDMDFATGLRSGDTFRAVTEALYRDGKFVKYGRILAAEFINNGKTHRAYRFKPSSGAENATYFAEDGKSLRRAFLKAPLTYRRISSGFSFGRRHPILKTIRPHLGVDYAAPRGTPVSAVGDGTVVFAGWKGANGNLVIIKHNGSFRTSYGHLRKITRSLHRGKKVSQGQVIGWVGSTGRATGPHLDFRIKRSGRFVNPLRLAMPRDKSVPQENMIEFASIRNDMDQRLASIITGETLLALGDSVTR